MQLDKLHRKSLPSTRFGFLCTDFSVIGNFCLGGTPLSLEIPCGTLYNFQSFVDLFPSASNESHINTD